MGTKSKFIYPSSVKSQEAAISTDKNNKKDPFANYIKFPATCTHKFEDSFLADYENHRVMEQLHHQAKSRTSSLPVPVIDAPSIPHDYDCQNGPRLSNPRKIQFNLDENRPPVLFRQQQQQQHPTPNSTGVKGILKASNINFGDKRYGSLSSTSVTVTSESSSCCSSSTKENSDPLAKKRRLSEIKKKIGHNLTRVDKNKFDKDPFSNYIASNLPKLRPKQQQQQQKQQSTSVLKQEPEAVKSSDQRNIPVLLKKNENGENLPRK